MSDATVPAGPRGVPVDGTLSQRRTQSFHSGFKAMAEVALAEILRISPDGRRQELRGIASAVISRQTGRDDRV